MTVYPPPPKKKNNPREVYTMQYMYVYWQMSEDSNIWFFCLSIINARVLTVPDVYWVESLKVGYNNYLDFTCTTCFPPPINLPNL